MDRNINEKIRKPRRTKGTPFFKQRNYFAFAFLGASILSGVALEFWSQTASLRKKLLDGKFEFSDSVKDRIYEVRIVQSNPNMQHLLKKIREKKEGEELPEDKTWFERLIESRPDY